MNFQDLFNKIKAIDEGKSVEECGGMRGAPASALKPMPGDDILTGECGGDLPGDIMRPPAPKQSDSVTMNVSINGSGAGGIRDLMDVLKDIQDGPSHGHDDPLMGSNPIEIAFGEEQQDGGFTNATTSPEQQVAGVEMVTPTGDDLSSKGGEAEKVNGGGNPMNVDENLVSRLQAHYESIKGGPVDEGMWDTIKQGAQSAVQGAQQLGQQAVQGVKNAANTVANTTVGDAAKAVGQAGLAQAKALANPGAAIGGALKQAGDAVTNFRNNAAQKVAGAAGNALQAVGQGAQALGQKIAAPAQTPIAPVAGVVPGAEFGDIGKGAEFGDLPPAQGAAPQLAPAAKAAAQKLASAGQAGMMNAFESAEMDDIKKLAGL